MRYIVIYNVLEADEYGPVRGDIDGWESQCEQSVIDSWWQEPSDAWFYVGLTFADFA